MNRNEYEKKCFSPNWIEIDLEAVEKQAKEKEVYESGREILQVGLQNSKEASLESKRRKDLKTLLKELEEIRQNIEKAVEKQHRLANLMGFYTGEFAK